jgi:hypothetical protein
VQKFINPNKGEAKMNPVDLVEDATIEAAGWNSGDPLRAARGCVLGVILGACLWTAILWAAWSLGAF